MGRVLKAALGFGAAALLLAAAASLYLQSSDFQGRVGAWIVDALEGRFPVRVELDGCELRVFGARLRLKGLRVYNDLYPAEQPAVDIDQVEVNFSITSFLKPSASLDALQLEALKIHMTEDPNGRINLWNMFRNQNDQPTRLTGFIGLAIKRLDIRDGLIVVGDQPLSLQSANGGMNISMTYVENKPHYEGLLSLKGLDLEIGGLALAGLDAEVPFALFDNSIEFPAATMASPQLEGRVSGVIDDLGEFVYRFETNLTLHPEEFTQPPLGEVVSGGQVGVAGVLSGAKSAYGFVGRLDSPSLTVGDLVFRNFQARARMDSESALVDQVQAGFEGGIVEADGELSWDEARTSQFRVRGRALGLSRLAKVVSPVHLSGRADFTGRLQWPGLNWDQVRGPGSLTFQGNFSFPASPELGPDPPFPFSGASDFAVENLRISFSEGMIETLGGQLSFQGFVDAAPAYDFNWRFESPEGSGPIQAARQTGLAQPDLWERLGLDGRGPVKVAASLRGKDGDFRVGGQARFENLWAKSVPAGDSAVDFQVTPEAALVEQATLTHGRQLLQARLDYAFDAGLRELRLTAAEVDLSRMAKAADFEEPLQGSLSGDLSLQEDSEGQFIGEGTLTASSLELRGQKLDRLSARLRLLPERVEAVKLEADLGSGRIEGEGSWEPRRQNIEARLTGVRIPLQRVAALADLGLSGEAGFAARLWGTADAPRFDFRLDADSLETAGQQLRNIALEARNKPEDWSAAVFSARAEFLGNTLEATGRVGLLEPFPVQAAVDLTDFPLDPYFLLAPIDTDVPLGGIATGNLALNGNLLDPANLDLQASFSRLRLSMAGYQLENKEQVIIILKSGALQILPTTLLGPQTELNVAGSLELTGRRNLNVKTSGQVNLRVLHTFLPGASASGRLTVESLRFFGTLDEPKLVGEASLQEGFLRHPDLPIDVFNAAGKFRFTADQVSIEEFSTRSRYGAVRADGGIFLENLKPVRWLINIDGSGLRLDYPENVESILDVSLNWINNQESQLLSGNIFIQSAQYQEKISLPDLILRYSGASVLLPAGAPGQELVLDLEVAGYRTLSIDNNLAQVTASGDFKIRGTSQNPVVLGSLTVDEGKLFLEGNEYEIIRGTIAFNDPRATRPVFNFEAETEVRDFSVTILLQGPLDQLNAKFRSDPPLPTSSVLSLLAVGQTEEEIFGVEGRGQDQVGSLAIYGAGALLSKSLGRKLEEQTSRLFGFEKLSIDPFLYGSERDPGARVTLGKKLGNNLSVTYSTDLGNQGQGQIVTVELKLTDWLTAVGTGDQNGAVAIDFKLRKRF